LAQSALADAGHDGKSRRRSRRGRGEESDGCIVPMKPRTKLARVNGGDGGGQANRTSDLLACDKNACPIRFGSILPPWVSNKLGRSRWIGSLRASKAWMTQGAGKPTCMISMLF